jgi:hypothetical protein
LTSSSSPDITPPDSVVLFTEQTSEEINDSFVVAQNAELKISEEESDAFSMHVSLYNNDVIASWADEVDREFPLDSSDLLDKTLSRPPCSLLSDLLGTHGPIEADSPIMASATATAAGSSFSPDLQLRIQTLEAELSNTKQVLGKTISDLNRLQKNEKVMDAIVRKLCAELAAKTKQENLYYSAQRKYSNTLSCDFGTFTPPFFYSDRFPIVTPPRSPQSKVDSSVRTSPLTPNALPCFVRRTGSPLPTDNLRLGGLASEFRMMMSQLPMDSARSSLYIESIGSGHYMDSARTCSTAFVSFAADSTGCFQNITKA